MRRSRRELRRAQELDTSSRDPEVSSYWKEKEPEFARVLLDVATRDAKVEDVEDGALISAADAQILWFQIAENSFCLEDLTDEDSRDREHHG